MLHRSRSPLGRSRVMQRSDRRVAAEPGQNHMLASRQVACRFVAARWPELARVEPVVTARLPRRPSPEILDRLGLKEAEIVLRAVSDVEYTFTFTRERELPDGLTAPLVAVVTVDEHQRIVKTVVSK